MHSRLNNKLNLQTIFAFTEMLCCLFDVHITGSFKPIKVCETVWKKWSYYSIKKSCNQKVLHSHQQRYRWT